MKATNGDILTKKSVEIGRAVEISHDPTIYHGMLESGQSMMQSEELANLQAALYRMDPQREMDLNQTQHSSAPDTDVATNLKQDYQAWSELGAPSDSVGPDLSASNGANPSDPRRYSEIPNEVVSSIEPQMNNMNSTRGILKDYDNKFCYKFLPSAFNLFD